MDYIFKILLLAEAVLVIYSSPTVSSTNPDLEAAKNYLLKYNPGYSAIDMDASGVSTSGEAPPDLSLDEDPNFRDNVVNFQKMANIPATGIVNDETMEKMEQSRCGVLDTPSDPNGPGRYQVQSRWWSKKNKKTGLYIMTYTYSKRLTPNDLKFQSFRKGITLAMCQWELISNVRFRNMGVGKKNTDIEISYEKKNHGDGYAFDGRGGTLGHAFYPEDGRVHLDLEELWYLASPSNENRRKKDVYTAALHELGHTIGLLHSQETDAVMAPFYHYRGYFNSFTMPNDELAGVENMYGKRIDSNPATERFSACREAKKRYNINVSPSKSTNATKETAVVETFEEEPCEDDPIHAEKHCPIWKARKLCEVSIFVKTMHKRCKKTCGFCPGTKKPEKVSRLSSNSICDVSSFDSIMTTYDQTNGFSALIFKDNYYFKMEVALVPAKYATHTLLNKTEDIKGSYKFDTDPRSISPGLFKIQTPNFFYKTVKADASVLVGKRYFTFDEKTLHLYKEDVVGVVNFETSYEVANIFPGFSEPKVDAAHASVNEEEDTVLFTLFSGCKMWQYKEYRDQGQDNLLMTPVFEKSGVNISEWKGVAACDVDAVFDYRGVPYFVKGNIFWPATNSEPQTPRDITYNLFRCWDKEPTDMKIPSDRGSGNGVLGQHTTSMLPVILLILFHKLLSTLFLSI